MKKTLVTVGLIGMTVLGACQNGEAGAKEDIYTENGNTINVTERNEHFNPNRAYNGNEQSMKNFGYVRHQEDPIDGRGNQNTSPVLNREALADSISRMLVTIPNVHDAATLVTDEEVLIAYDAETSNRFETADQVKKTAISIVPRYYHVYVSDQPTAFQEVERFGQMDVNSKNVDSLIKQTIEDMLNSPQGRKLSEGENENGESIGEMNDHIENDDINQQIS